MLCVELCGQSRLKGSWGDRAGLVGGGGMTQLAVSVILVGKCVLAQGERDEAGFAGGAGSVNGRGRRRRSAVLGIVLEDGRLDVALRRETGWIVGFGNGCHYTA